MPVFMIRIISCLILSAYLTSSADLSSAYDDIHIAEDSLAAPSRFAPMAKTYKTSDGQYIAVSDATAIVEDTEFRKLSEAIYANTVALVAVGDSLYYGLSEYGLNELLKKRDPVAAERVTVIKKESGAIFVVCQTVSGKKIGLKCFAETAGRLSSSARKILLPDGKPLWIEEISRVGLEKASPITRAVKPGSSDMSSDRPDQYVGGDALYKKLKNARRKVAVKPGSSDMTVKNGKDHAGAAATSVKWGYYDHATLERQKNRVLEAANGQLSSEAAYLLDHPAEAVWGVNFNPALYYELYCYLAKASGSNRPRGELLAGMQSVVDAAIWNAIGVSRNSDRGRSLARFYIFAEDLTDEQRLPAKLDSVRTLKSEVLRDGILSADIISILKATSAMHAEAVRFGQRIKDSDHNFAAGDEHEFDKPLLVIGMLSEDIDAIRQTNRESSYAISVSTYMGSAYGALTKPGRTAADIESAELNYKLAINAVYFKDEPSAFRKLTGAKNRDIDIATSDSGVVDDVANELAAIEAQGFSGVDGVRRALKLEGRPLRERIPDGMFGRRKDQVNPEVQGRPDGWRAFVAREASRGKVFADTLRLRAMEARQKGQKIIVALETNSWIPSEQRGVIQPLLSELSRLEEHLRRMGLDNVRIVRGEGDELAGNILAEQSRLGVKDSGVVVLASQKTLGSGLFDRLRSTESEEKAFLAEIDYKDIEGLNYIRLLEMLTIVARMAFGEPVGLDGHPDIAVQELGRRIVRIIPRAEPFKRGELRDIYENQAKALVAA